jgi:molybdopterin-guanine dinucleotide biosynthesis protein A
MSRILGAVLAGGQARRFGSDKAVATLDGVPLIDRSIAALAPQVHAVLICGRAWRDFPSVADRPHGGLGPLAGLNAALHYGAHHRFGNVVIIPCDAPDVPADAVQILRRVQAPCFAALAPVIGIWPTALADALDRHLTSGTDRSMRRWAAVAGAVAVDMGDIGNVNTPSDLAKLAARHE